jgi:hypothetical protein
MPSAVSSAGALLAPDGWKTPAKAATARPAAARTAMRANFMRLSFGVVCDEYVADLRDPHITSGAALASTRVRVGPLPALTRA